MGFVQVENRPVSYSRPHWGEWRETHQSEANAGKKSVDELFEWRIIIVLLLTAQIRNRKTFEKYLELANVRFFFHSF